MPGVTENGGYIEYPVVDFPLSVKIDIVHQK